MNPISLSSLGQDTSSALQQDPSPRKMPGGLPSLPCSAAWQDPCALGGKVLPWRPGSPRGREAQRAFGVN